ncbi:MAG: sulfatase, partial [Rikenellaceae bacterium]
AVGYTTHNIDKMAAEGMRLTQFLTAAPFSGPSRAGLMTGCYPVRVNFTGNLTPGATKGLSPKEMTMAELLKQKGYTTAAYGKWHLGEKREFLPLQRGFDEFYGIPYSHDMWLHHPQNSKYKFGDLPTLSGNDIVEINVDPARITTDYTEHTVDFIKRNKKNPFFIYLAHPMPHTPLAVSDKFKGKSEVGLYGDVMMELDWSVAQILKALRTEKIEENTMVVLTSDNGPALMYGNHAGSSGGLREGKGATYEGGHRVPCIIYWKGVVEAGSVSSKLASNIDLFATAAEISGAPLPERAIDGVSLLPILKGEPGANPRKYYIYQKGAGGVRAVSNGLYKLVFPHSFTSCTTTIPGKDGIPGKRAGMKITTMELYDLRRDAGERYNVISEHPEIMEELKQVANEYRQSLKKD